MGKRDLLYIALWFLDIGLLSIGIPVMAVGKLYIGGFFIGISIFVILSLPEDGLRQKFDNILKQFDENKG